MKFWILCSVEKGFLVFTKSKIKLFQKIKQKGIQKGQVAIIFAFGFVAFVGFMGLVVDGGHLYVEHRKLQNASDLASIAGTWAYYEVEYKGCLTATSTTCTGSATYPNGLAGVQNAEAEAQKAADRTLVQNGYPNLSVELDFMDVHNVKLNGGQTVPSTCTSTLTCTSSPNTDACINSGTGTGCPGPADVREVQVTMTSAGIPTYFLNLFGVHTSTVSGGSTAAMGPPQGSTKEGPVILINYSGPTFNIPRNSSYGSGAAQCYPNPGDGIYYPSIPDCRPKTTPSSWPSPNIGQVQLRPEYEGAFTPASTYAAPFNTAPIIQYYVMHNNPSCPTATPNTPDCTMDSSTAKTGLQQPILNCPPTNPTNPSSPPPSTCSSSYAYYGALSYIVGGTTGGWSHQCAGTSCGPSYPVPRSYPAMAYDGEPAISASVIFGGFSATYTDLQDMWQYKLSSVNGSGTWTQITPVACSSAHGSCSGPGSLYPPARSNAGMVYDAATNSLVLFGGYQSSTSKFLNDTWTWTSTAGWVEKDPTGSSGYPCNSGCPEPLWFPSMAYDTGNSNVILFGGLNAAYAYRGNTWKWNGSGWTQMCAGAQPACTTAPPPRWEAGFAYGVAGGIVLYGGDNGTTGFLSDMYVWNGTTNTWSGPQTITGNSVGARTNFMLAYNSIPSSTLLFFGGGNQSPAPTCPSPTSQRICNDTNSYSGSTTIAPQAPANSPPPTRSAGMVYDNSQGSPGVVVMFGGGACTAGAPNYCQSTPPTIVNDVWTWQPTSPSVINDDLIWQAMNDRITQASTAGSKWASQDCSRPDGDSSTGVPALSSDNPRLMRLPIYYSAEPLPQYTTGGQTNVVTVKSSETVVFCIQYNGVSATLPSKELSGANQGAYSITGYIVSEPTSSGESITYQDPYFGQDMTIHIVQ